MFSLELHLFLRMRLEMSVFEFCQNFRRNGIGWQCKYKPLLLILNSYLKIYETKQTKLIIVNTILTVALLSLFGAFFITIYFWHIEEH